MEKKEILNLIDSVWKEKVCIETTEYIIQGYVFMPKIGKRNRLLSEVLNSNKDFIAVKECKLESKINPKREVEYYDFLQVNLSSILLMRPLNDD